MKKRKPTIKDVAQRANVSVATVSRVLNNLPGFSIETEKHVRDAMKELNYQYNAVARDLKNKKTNTIAVLIPDVETTFYVKILSAIEHMARKVHYSVMVCFIGVSGSAMQEYIQMLTEKRVDGIIGCSIPPIEHIGKLLYNSGIPCVLVSTLPVAQYPMPYVRVDDYQASYAATSYLISRGHRRIAMLAGSENDEIAGKLRLEGYLSALEAHGIRENRELIEYTLFSFESGVPAARKLLAKREQFTAIVACSDDVALAVCMVAYEQGLSIPEDISVIGYDNTKTAEMAIPSLTTVSQPLYEMGQKAFEQMVELQEGRFPASVILPYQIVERKSVRTITE